MKASAVGYAGSSSGHRGLGSPRGGPVSAPHPRCAAGGSRGPEFLYAWPTSHIARADFELTLKTDWANHMPGGRTEIEVLVRRRGGFAGPVKISAEGLPTGLRAEPLEIAGRAPSGKLVLLSDAAMAPPGDALLKDQRHRRSQWSSRDARRHRTPPGPGRGRCVGWPVHHADTFTSPCSTSRCFACFAARLISTPTGEPFIVYQMEVERFEGLQWPDHSADRRSANQGPGRRRRTRNDDPGRRKSGSAAALTCRRRCTSTCRLIQTSMPRESPCFEDRWGT